ncbi:MAG: Hpt domain-containing protein [Paracoccaceae bacterium]|jgi:hypothetical protein|nr:Hpt domain-containing protein [Paracoccaceae bacterium]MDG1802207.1 Hpt domain-containing protein [Paracoccaceae bacterium]MDG2452259.1 Hpt domain-containing protein [Paracoccaceae bacterium]
MIAWDRNVELKEDFGQDGFREIIELFLSEVDLAIKDLPLATDHQTTLERLHFIKGSALNLGFTELASLCEPNNQDGQAVKPADVEACYLTSKTTFFADPRSA